MDFDEAVAVEMVAEELADASLDAIDGLVGERAQIDHTVVQLGVLLDGWQAGRLVLILYTTQRNRISNNTNQPNSEQQQKAHLSFGPHRVLEKQRQTRLRLADDEHLRGVQLDVALRARLDLGRRLAHPALHVDDALARDAW